MGLRRDIEGLEFASITGPVLGNLITRPTQTPGRI